MPDNQPKPRNAGPPRWAQKLLSRWGDPNTREEVEGDLLELYAYWLQTVGKPQADGRYWLSALKLLRPLARPRSFHPHSPPEYETTFFLSPAMIRNYFKIAFRNLRKNQVYSFINIAGLATGMAVAMLIGLWVYDELSFNQSFQNYDRIAKVMQRGTFEGEVFYSEYMPLPLGDELRTAFAADFTYVVKSSWTREHILAYGDKKFTKTGNYLSPEAPDMLTLKMISGTRAGLKDLHSILLSRSAAQALFGTTDPLGKVVKIDNMLPVKVTGVYEDLPNNTEFSTMQFMAPWDLYISSEAEARQAQDNVEWPNNSWQILAQLAPQADLDAVSKKIKNLRLKYVPETAYLKPEILLQPMRRWHLYTGWDKSGNVDARIQYVWLFGIIGAFVLLLACINFMNLSTARSEKRAKEVGIRKAVGSVRSQLISQFLSESLLVTGFAFALSLLLVALMLPFFNEVAGKQIGILWTNPGFWLMGLGFSVVTGLIAGSYPAFYLSSFQAVKVLKGTFRTGRLASVPRQVLVVVQFTVSVTLIIGTIIVFRQIQFAKNRPVGYDRQGLITVAINTPELREHYNVLRSDLLETGAVVDMSTSSSPATNVNSQNGGFDWVGKDPAFKDHFGTIAVTHDYGRTVGWQFVRGRDLSRQFATDSSGMILNETAVRYMGLRDPVGQQVKWNGRAYQVVGVVKDMVTSPFAPAYQTIFMLNYEWANVINIKLNPGLSARASLAKIENVFQKINPGSPFDYKFTDQQYALKFAAEERMGQLALVFAVLAIFISCLGLFGLASFMAEQRTKEIGVRKVLGASILNLWSLLSKDFMRLVIIAFGIATPIAYYFLNNWLQRYDYRTEISWWIFAAAGLGAVLITLLTVSFQSIRAALMNPVKSLRTE